MILNLISIMRRGKELYSRKFEEAVKLHEQGIGTKEIAAKLGVSYSAAYSWTKKGRKPETGQLNDFVIFLQEGGPQPLIEVTKKFPKHSELFLSSRQRGLPVARYKLPKIMGSYTLWYYIKGQEAELDKRVKEVLAKREQIGNEFIAKLDMSKLS